MKTYHAIVILLLCSCVIVSTSCLFCLLNNTGRVLSKERNSGSQLEIMEMDWSSDVYYRITSEGNIIKNPAFIEYLSKNDLLNQDILVIKYSNLSCDPCMDFLIKQLNDSFSNLNENNHILFVASDFKSTDGNRYGQTLYLPYGESFDMELEDLNVPFLFVYRNQVRSIFVPDSGYQDVFETYLSSIKYHFGI